MLGLLAKLFGRIVARRNAAYDAHRRPIVEVDAPVVSVGNISAGGTGKTPVVQHIVRLLQASGHRPAVILRGYRRRSRGLLVVHDGEHICTTPDAAGDEAYLHASVLDVPVVVCEDKVEAAAIAVGTLPCDVVVVDDGYQHRALHRDCDIVLVDTATMRGELIPKGRLREPLANLNRAHVVLCMDDVAPEDVQPFVRADALVLTCTVEAGSVVSADQRATPISAGTRVYAAAGIAQPERFVRSLEDKGYQVTGTVFFRDHHRYTKRDVDRLCAAAMAQTSLLVVTDKDAVKLLPLMNVSGTAVCPLHVLPIQAHVEGTALADLLESRIKR